MPYFAEFIQRQLTSNKGQVVCKAPRSSSLVTYKKY